MHFVRHWHARLGVFAALFFLLLAISGLALNHTDALGLAKREIYTPWLMHWYGLKSAAPTRGYLFKNGYLATAEGLWVMDGRQLSANNKAPVGALTWGDMRVIASADNLYLYSPDGQLVDKLSGSDLPNKTLKQLGILATSETPKLVLGTAQGDFVSDDGLTWQPLVQNQNIKRQLIWSGEQDLPSSLLNGLNVAFSPSLPLERIVLDLHSGRIFGRFGPLLMDVAAMGLLILSLSGVWIYLRTVRRKPRH